MALINVHTDTIARILGYSHEQALRECTVRELLLHLGTVAAMTADKAGPQPQAEDTPDYAEANTFLAQVAQER